MFDTFPYDTWLDANGNLNQDIAGFWTWGPENSTGTYILTALGIIVMLIAFWGFVRLENQKLARQAERLRGSMQKPTTMGPTA